MKLLTRQEELILLSIWKLGQNAYGNAIRKDVSESTGKNWLIGSVYMPISKMLKSGLLSSSESEPIAERGGRRKVVYRLTEDGKKALAKMQEVNSALWAGIPPLQAK